MEKRFQVFVSSTYADLKEERQKVLQALMEMDCIPAGMEIFPAADEEQWEFIKKIIDDCDYYLLIIGGRYGSITDEGISYTEKEFDYAVEKGLKVVALIHSAPEDIPFGKSEKDPELRQKLIDFKKKVKNGRLVKFWEKATELPGLVALSLTKTIKMYPAVGWVRASNIDTESLLSELNELRKQNSELQNLLKNLRSQQKLEIEDIADLDSIFKINCYYETKTPGYSSRRNKFEIEISWREIFSLISPYLLEYPNSSYVNSKLASNLKDLKYGEIDGYGAKVNDQDFKTITLQFKAYGLVDVRYQKNTKGGMNLFWSLTEKGEKLMTETRVIRKN